MAAPGDLFVWPFSFFWIIFTLFLSPTSSLLGCPDVEQQIVNLISALLIAKQLTLPYLYRTNLDVSVALYFCSRSFNASDL